MKKKLFLIGTGFLILFFQVACVKFEEPVPNSKPQWEIFNIKSGLANDSVFCLLEDPNGDILIGTQSGISIYQDGGFSLWTNPKIIAYSLHNSQQGIIAATNYGSLLFKDHSILYVDSLVTFPTEAVGYYNGYYWSGTKMNGLFCNGTSLIEEIPDPSINDLLINDQDTWISTCNSGIFKIIDIENSKKIEHYTNRNGLTSNNCLVAYMDNDKSLWVGTHSNNGLCQFSEDGFLSYNFPYITSIVQDLKGYLWLGSGIYGVYKWDVYNTGNIINYTMINGLPGNRITKVIVTRDGSIWAATEDAGIAKLKPQND